ncbi:hypothetical protein K1719_040378 [Acacia pycnantha]|nr:hypothetical protein K1719_040378 [Acacia pycnantha]
MRPKNPLKLIPLSNGYYIVSFSNKEDREYAFQEGPWMIEDHYLIVQRWRPNFNPWKADLQCNIAAWIRLLDVPFEFYNVESLRRIGSMVGRMIKVDRSTSVYDKGGFARVCVEIDLKKPLLPSYTVFGEECPIIYEGLHNVCLACGSMVIKRQGVTWGRKRIKTKRMFRKVTDGKRVLEVKSDLREMKLKQGIWVGTNDNRGDVGAGFGTGKAEWVQVGVKRKNVGKGKGKSRGKENRPPSLPRAKKMAQGGGKLPLNSLGPNNGLGMETGFEKKGSVGITILVQEPKEFDVPIAEVRMECASNGDALMCDQDQTVGAAAIPPTTSTVSL